MFFFREIFLEKHWKSVISKNVCDYFFEAQKKVGKAFKFATGVTLPHLLYRKIFLQVWKGKKKKKEKKKKLFRSLFLKINFFDTISIINFIWYYFFQNKNHFSYNTISWWYVVPLNLINEGQKFNYCMYGKFQIQSRV